MIVLETERLNLRWFDIKDASFILELVNDPAWIQFIGDKGVRNLEDAKNYIVKITSIDNIASGKLLEKVGLRFEKIISDSGEDLKLFGYNA
ncbi:hypothetical protein MRP26_17525 [Bacillus sp. CCB-MMP212]|uniref:GNAT family N-acetyltransferase n=1 Tax=Bacillus sp. CCB-MMP212 TaxID=2928002 RepID=UPI001F61036C|nr:hypothetical protein [Bacillus sp. CCB-MMP212]MCI4250759.1 hypothetical protein [Bacillus sp. CCB-MMP212]